MRHVGRRSLCLLWLTLAIVLMTSGVGAQSATTATDAKIREAVKQYLAGYASNTVEGYFQHYAPDVTMWWPNGLRQQRAAYYKTWDEGLKAGNTVESAELDDLRIHSAPSGDAGVASFIWKIKRKTGEPYALQTSTTFFERGGKWQIVHMHFNRVASPPRQGATAPAAAASGPRNTAAPSPAPAPAAQPQPVTGVAKEVESVIGKLTQSYGANDLDGYFSIYAPDLTWWGPGGRSDRESYRKSWTENIAKTGGLQSAATSDMRIQVSPGNDLAVASYLLKVTRRNPAPNSSPTATYEMSPTLIKRNGTWTIVHLHFQVVPEPKASD